MILDSDVLEIKRQNGTRTLLIRFIRYVVPFSGILRKMVVLSASISDFGGSPFTVIFNQLLASHTTNIDLTTVTVWLVMNYS